MKRATRIRKQGRDLRIKHATAPIAFGRGKIHRARLVDLLLSSVSRKLIVVAAPPGYGKTTLLADFAAHAGMAICWLRLNEGISDAVDLAQLLVASLTFRFRRLKSILKPTSLVGLSSHGLARHIAEVVEIAIEEPFVIIVDDVQEANKSEEAVAFLDGLTESFPPHVTILVAGREPPEVSLARLMAEGNLAGLGPQDLALTREEVISLLAVRGVKEGVEMMGDELLETTRGWITGVLLSKELARSGGSRPGLEQRPMVYEYLASVVVSRLPDNLRTFMRESSVMRTMEASSCDEVLGAKDSEVYLSQLAKKGLFVTVSDDLPRSYQYHPLLRQYLLTEMEASSRARLGRLRARAARYHEKQSVPEDAFALYMDAGKPSEAKRVAEQHGRRLFRAGRYKTLQNWCDQIRQNGVPSILLLRLVANTYVDRGQLERARAILKEIDILASHGSPVDSRGAIENLRGVIALRMGNLDEVRSCVSRAQKLLKRGKERYLHLGMSKRLQAQAVAGGGESMAKAEALGLRAVKYLELAGEEFSLAQALIDLYGYQLLGGRPIDAWHSINRAQRILEQLGSPLHLAICSHNLGVLLHQRGRIEEALLKFVEAIRLASQSGAPVREAQATFSQADLFCDLRLYRQAGELYERGLDLATLTGDAETLGFGCLRIAVLHERAGNVALAEGWLARAEGFVGARGRIALSVTLQRAALRMVHSPRESADVLTSLVRGQQGSLDVYDLVLARYLLSYLRDQEGAAEVSRKMLLEAVTYARTTGSEQAIVGEANCSELSHEFLRRMQNEIPEIARILERIDLMREVARQFDEGPREVAQSGKLVVEGFGRGSIKYRGSELRGLRPLHRDILHYIVDRGRADRDEVVEEFWADHPAGRQAANLHMAIYSLRKAIGRDSLVLDGRFYSLADSLGVEYDVAEFERASSAALRLPPGDPRKYFALTEAANSYRGRFLENLDYSWSSIRRRSLESLFLEVADLYSGEALRRGYTSSAIDILSRALSVDPLRDGLNIKYIEALGTVGRRQELVGHYARYVKLLSEDLGLDPSPEVRSTYQRMIS